MKTRLTPTEEFKQIFIENFLNSTDGVTKIEDNSVLNAISFGIAKIAQKATKDIANVEANIFPDAAVGDQLDNIAANFGISPRKGSSISSTYVRLQADAGTVYQAGVQQFSGNENVLFDLVDDVTIGPLGYSYAKVRSVDAGSRTNVNPFAINSVNPVPAGHTAVLNEYKAIGGRDQEDDATFRLRIKEGGNILARHTLSYLEQVFVNINSDVLRVHFQGFDDNGNIVLSILTQNAVDLTQSELDQLYDEGGDYLAISDLLYPNATSYGVVLQNITYFPIDIDFRVSIDASFNADDVRVDIQTRISKLLDHRFWRFGIDRVEWDDLLQIVKTTRGVLYTADETFSPRVDLEVPNIQVPLVRSFVMRDLAGAVISDANGVLNPTFYTNNPDSTFISTVVARQ